MDDAAVSAAIEQHLGLMWDAATEGKMRAMVGEAGLARIREIDAWVNRAELWTAVGGDEAYRQVKRELAERYGGLTEGAREQLATRAAWGWK